MITKVWLRLALLLAIAIIPATLLQLKLQADGVTVLFELADKTGARAAIDDDLAFLRDEARRDPTREVELKSRFKAVTMTKRSLEEFFLAQGPVTDDLTRQILLITATVLALSLAASVFLSRQIVARVRALLAERDAAGAKLRALDALERWQTVARTLVHELRAPLTPLKLIATDIEQKHGSLSDAAFAGYLAESQRLVREELAAIEAMIGSFTAFGRLPKAVRAPAAFGRFLHEFSESYGRAFGAAVNLTCVPPTGPEREVSMDSKLMRDLLFNLCKNAAEANPGRALKLTVRGAYAGGRVILTVHNDGKPVPESFRRRMFEPYVSSHDRSADATKPSGNMGLGLAISRKIALDHGGDLTLAQSDERGVMFQCEFPAAPPAEAPL